jgi:general secretion pathway protein D
MIWTGFTRILACALLVSISCVSLAETAAATERKISFKHDNAELKDILQAYSQAAGQKFVIDPGVRGKATILLPEKVTIDEAFNLLSSALAVNGYAIVTNGDTMQVMAARNVERSNHDVLTELPALKPERIVTMVYTPKHTSAMDINKSLRILVSKDGELSPYENSNKLIITDWVSNLHRIWKVLNEVDQPGKELKK